MIFNIKISTIVNIAFVALVCFVSLLFLQTKLEEAMSPWIGRLGIIVMVWCAITNYVQTKNWFSLVFMFETSLYVFTLGQSFLCGLGIENGQFNQYLREPIVDVNTAIIFNILCLAFLHIGVLFYLKRQIATPQFISGIDYTKQMKKIGWMIFPFAFTATFVEMRRLFIVYRSLGYRAAFASIAGTTSWAKLFSLIGDFFPFILFLLFIAYRDNKRINRLIALGIILLSLTNFMIGNRSEPICYIVSLLWLTLLYSQKTRERRKNVVISSLVVFSIMVVIPIIGQTRNTGELTVSGIIEGLSGENSAIGLVFTTVSNLGYSVFPTIKTMQLIPNYFPFHYGQSYLYAVIGIVPNVIGGTHIAVQHAALAQWLMNSLNMKYGPGFSLPAEAYYNFGWYGILIMPLIGFGVTKLLNERNVRGNALRTFIVVGCFIVLFSVPRRDSLTALRNLVYYVGFIVLAIKILAKGVNREF